MSTSEDGDTMKAQAAPEARQAPRWQRLWVVLCSRFPSLSVGAASADVEGGMAGPRRMRMLGFACLGVAVMVILAGTTVGSLLGAAALQVVDMITYREPLVTGGTGVQ
jgi:hypothetical protein